MALTKRERVWAAVHGDKVDRPPFAFWHHFKPHNVPHALAHSTIDFYERFDLDIAKIMPDLPYPFPSSSIHQADEWDLVAELQPNVGNLGRMIQTTKLVRDRLGPTTPLVVTVFSPITEARRFAGGPEAIHEHLVQNPADVHGALGVLAGNLSAYCRALLDAGADGIYYALQGIADGWLSESEFREFARPYDFQVLNACSAGWLNVVHLHGGSNLMVDLGLDYPCSVVSWEDRQTGVRLDKLREKLGTKAAMGGIDERGAIARGDIADLTREIRDALDQTDGGRHLILAPGCSVPDDIDEEHLRQARRAVDDLFGTG